MRSGEPDGADGRRAEMDGDRRRAAVATDAEQCNHGAAAEDLTDIEEQLNQETLRVTGLAAGRYALQHRWRGRGHVFAGSAGERNQSRGLRHADVSPGTARKLAGARSRRDTLHSPAHARAQCRYRQPKKART